MANFYITHSAYPDNPQFFTINISQIVKSDGEENTDFFRDHRGECYWEISIYTTGTGVDGNPLDTVWIDEFSSESDIDEAVANKLQTICSLIDWSSSGEFSELQDVYPPFVSEQYPADGEQDVPIGSSIRVVVKENLPGLGIDISTLTFKVNGMQVVPTITGNPYEYTLSYKPVKLVG